MVHVKLIKLNELILSNNHCLIKKKKFKFIIIICMNNYVVENVYFYELIYVKGRLKFTNFL